MLLQVTGSGVGPGVQIPPTREIVNLFAKNKTKKHQLLRLAWVERNSTGKKGG